MGVKKWKKGFAREKTPPVCCLTLASSPSQALRASSPKGRALGMAGKFLAEVQSAPERRSPLPSSPTAMPDFPFCRCATSSPGRGKSFLSGGAGCERSEQTERVGVPLGELSSIARLRGYLPKLPQSAAQTAPSGMGPLAWRESYRVNCKVSGFARGSPFGRAGTAGD